MATKKTGALDAMRLAASSKKTPKDTRATVTIPAEPEYLTTAMHIRVDQWERLRELAHMRVKGTRRRPSVSAAIVEMLDRHLAEMEREAGINR